MPAYLHVPSVFAADLICTKIIGWKSSSVSHPIHQLSFIFNNHSSLTFCFVFFSSLWLFPFYLSVIIHPCSLSEDFFVSSSSLLSLPLLLSRRATHLRALHSVEKRLHQASAHKHHHQQCFQIPNERLWELHQTQTLMHLHAPKWTIVPKLLFLTWHTHPALPDLLSAASESECLIHVRVSEVSDSGSAEHQDAEHGCHDGVPR